MEAYTLGVKTEEVNIVTLTKPGVVATSEYGKYIDEEEVPVARVTIIIQKNEEGVKAWVQYGMFNANQELIISHEGWIKEGNDTIVSAAGVSSLATSLEKKMSLIDSEQKFLEKIKTGAFGCCTKYGTGCYVTCCNSCCSDPWRCPGASCCG